jgi:hypothetical protein
MSLNSSNSNSSNKTQNKSAVNTPTNSSKSNKLNTLNNATIKKNNLNTEYNEYTEPSSTTPPKNPENQQITGIDDIFNNNNFITNTNKNLLKQLLENSSEDVLINFIKDYSNIVKSINVSEQIYDFIETFILIVVNYKPLDFELIKNIIFFDYFKDYYEIEEYEKYLITILNYFKYNLVFLILPYISNKDSQFYNANKDIIIKTIHIFYYNFDINFIYECIIEYISLKKKSYKNEFNELKYLRIHSVFKTENYYYANLIDDLKYIFCGTKKNTMINNNNDIMANIFLIPTVYNLDQKINMCNNNFFEKINYDYNAKIKSEFVHSMKEIGSDEKIIESLNYRNTDKPQKKFTYRDFFFKSSNDINEFDIYPDESKSVQVQFNLYYKTNIITSIIEKICSEEKNPKKTKEQKNINKKILYIFFYDIIITNIFFGFLKNNLNHINTLLIDDDKIFLYLHINDFFNWLLNKIIDKNCKKKLDEITNNIVKTNTNLTKNVKTNNLTKNVNKYLKNFEKKKDMKILIKTELKRINKKSKYNNNIMFSNSLKNKILRENKTLRKNKTLGGKQKNKTHKTKRKKRKQIKTKKHYNKTKE